MAYILDIDDDDELSATNAKSGGISSHLRSQARHIKLEKRI